MNASSQQLFFKEELQYQEIAEINKTDNENMPEPLQYRDIVTDKWVTAGPPVKRQLETDYEPNSKRVATDIDSLPTLTQNNAFYISNCNETMEGISGPSGIDELGVFKANTNNLDPEYIKYMNTSIYIGMLIPKNAFINMQGKEDDMIKLIGRETETAIWRHSPEDTSKVSHNPMFAAETRPYLICGKRKNVEHAFNWIKNWLNAYTRNGYYSSECIPDFDENKKEIDEVGTTK